MGGLVGGFKQVGLNGGRGLLGYPHHPLRYAEFSPAVAFLRHHHFLLTTPAYQLSSS